MPVSKEELGRATWTLLHTLAAQVLMFLVVKLSYMFRACLVVHFIGAMTTLFLFPSFILLIWAAMGPIFLPKRALSAPCPLISFTYFWLSKSATRKAWDGVACWIVFTTTFFFLSLNSSSINDYWLCKRKFWIYLPRLTFWACLPQVYIWPGINANKNFLWRRIR